MYKYETQTIKIYVLEFFNEIFFFSLQEVWLNTLVCAEIMCMFFVGEIIGKGSVIGYWIPGAWSIHGEDSRTWALECQKKK